MQMTGFEFEQNPGYAVVRFKTELHEMSWGDVENEASEIIEKMKAVNTSRILVDLTAMDLIQSGLVAALVRMWKATDAHKKRKLVIETANDVVRDVIRTAGLNKVFTVVDTREDAAREIGGSKLTTTERPDQFVIAWFALPAAFLATITLFPVFYMQDASVKGNAELAGLLLAASAFMASLVSIARDQGWSKVVGVLSMILTLVFFAGLYAGHNSGRQGPEEYRADDDSSESSPVDRPNAEETTDGEDGASTEGETDTASQSDSDDD
jgi:anti-anti-sigma factor